MNSPRRENPGYPGDMILFVKLSVNVIGRMSDVCGQVRETLDYDMVVVLCGRATSMTMGGGR